ENADSFDCRVRRLLHVLPYGMDNSLVVSELVPSEEAFPLLTNQHLADFETGLQRFIDGDWSEAWRFLHSMSADDRAQDFLAMQITQHGRTAPADWDGIVRMKKKDG
ncbi:MAG: adenylate/guanylate cyclase domain-containing protein, partial [Fuerstiella sp.]